MTENQISTNNNEERRSLTTQSVGVADAKARDLVGIILNQLDISTAATRTLIAANIPQKAIKAVRVGADKDNKLHIVAFVKIKDIYNKKKNDEKKKEKKKAKSIFGTLTDDIEGYEDSGSQTLPKAFFKATRNKIYHGKHADVKYVNNQFGRCAAIRFDPEVFLSFAYDIDFADPFTVVGVRPQQWMSDKEYRKNGFIKGISPENYKKLRNNYRKSGLLFCTVHINYRIKHELIQDEYKKLVTDIKSTIAREVSNVGGSITDVEQFANRVIMSAFNLNKFNGAINNSLKSKFNINQVKDWFNDDDNEDDED